MKPNRLYGYLLVCTVLYACQSVDSEAYLQIKEHTQAIKQATDDDARAVAYSLRADVYNEAGQHSQAIRDYTKAIELYSDDTEKSIMYSKRADLYFLYAQQYDEAEQDYLKSAELFSGPVRLFLDDGNFVELTKEDYTTMTYSQIATLYRDTEQYGKAIEYYTKAIERIEAGGEINEELYQLGGLYRTEELYQMRGQVYETLGQNANAKADYKKANIQ